MKAILLLEDGFYLEGTSFGAESETAGEVVFNTSMYGYQEILTDPSYKGQIVCMTYPLIGNYGVNNIDVESGKVCVEGFVVKEKSHIVSSWRAKGALDSYLKDNNIVAIEGIDTRALTRRLRQYGSMKGIISAIDLNLENLKKKLNVMPSIAGQDLVSRVTSQGIYDWSEGLGLRRVSEARVAPYTIVVIDCGVKLSILRNLKENFKRVIVVPYDTPLKEIIKLKPNGVLFSNGPGDPEAVTPAIATAKELVRGLKKRELKIAVMGICLGHQILGLALGGEAQKLKFGHHGGNHPVKDLATGEIDITSQNHNFIIPPESITDKSVVQTHINLYDHTSEGQKHREMPLFSVQFHPEAGPGPFDARYIFKEFSRSIESA